MGFQSRQTASQPHSRQTILVYDVLPGPHTQVPSDTKCSERQHARRNNLPCCAINTWDGHRRLEGGCEMTLSLFLLAVWLCVRRLFRLFSRAETQDRSSQCACKARLRAVFWSLFILCASRHAHHAGRSGFVRCVRVPLSDAWRRRKKTKTNKK